MLNYIRKYGAVAQLGERLTGSQKVAGSNPASSTFEAKNGSGRPKNEKWSV